MKKTKFYVLALLLLSVMLTACSRTMEEAPTDPAPEVSALPDTTQEKPSSMPKPDGTPVPDLNDGYVNDDDGLITEGDNGPLETIPQTSPMPGNGEKQAKKAG